MTVRELYKLAEAYGMLDADIKIYYTVDNGIEFQECSQNGDFCLDEDSNEAFIELDIEI